MQVVLNVIRADSNVLVNVCQKDLLGKEFRDERAILTINHEFYGGEEVDLEYAFSLFDEATVVSLVGNGVVDEAIRRGYVHKNGVLEVQGVKFAQIYNL
ncbi:MULTISPECIES: DUF424 domain-containing protein [Acidianus]|uniref:DUF424 domain-containing protein n=1 Tax=Candidatus Acidianus copahuensis TaxID=1160895 RepID=A0A031LUF9_9CREN|nr:MULTISPECIES: DUF424 family protein [Acidianus]EZQ11079.1 hypothetical protein CM19_02460 [Candidatus Acidianus copahuensis]NON62446.1 DUF424 family protein [Acidianus sp. RZ1]